MPRKPAKERNPIRGGRPPRDYEIGDAVFFSFAGTAGEGLFIGQLRVDPAILLLAQPPCIEVPASCRSPTGHINPQLGHIYRRKYLKRFPGKLRA